MCALKALCHAIMAGCLLMNPHAPMRQMKTGCDKRLISLHLVFKSGRWGSLCSKFDIHMCSISLSYLSLPFGCPLWASQLDHQQNVCAASVQPPHTPVHYTVILSMPIHFNSTNKLIKKQLHLILWHNTFSAGLCVASSWVGLAGACFT